MKTLTLLLSAALLVTARAEDDANLAVGAFARRFTHRDGSYTLTAKQGNNTKIVEETYKKNVLSCKRVFNTDTQGRLRNGVVFDGRKNPLGSIWYGYDKKTDQIMEEQHFNKKGQLVCRVFYPGALKDVPGVDPRVVREGAAINYNPDDPNAKPVQVAAPPPVRPVESEQAEFTPGVRVGRSAATVAGSQGNAVPIPAPVPPGNAAPMPAPPANGATAAAGSTPTPPPAPPRRRSFFGNTR